MILSVHWTNSFKKDYKKVSKQDRNIDRLFSIIERLANKEYIEQRYRNHKLTGEFSDCRELHIEPDWLLIYKLETTKLILIRTGSHSELFK